jgi:hypothetical protein
LLKTTVQLSPVRAWKEDWAYFFRYIAGLYLVISFMPLSQKFLVLHSLLLSSLFLTQTHSTLCLQQVLVQEKEKKIKEGMKMMGLAESAFLGGWMATYAILGTISALILSFAVSKSHFYHNTATIAFFMLVFLCMFS